MLHTPRGATERPKDLLVGTFACSSIAQWSHSIAKVRPVNPKRSGSLDTRFVMLSARTCWTRASNLAAHIEQQAFAHVRGTRCLALPPVTSWHVYLHTSAWSELQNVLEDRCQSAIGLPGRDRTTDASSGLTQSADGTSCLPWRVWPPLAHGISGHCRARVTRTRPLTCTVKLLFLVTRLATHRFIKVRRGTHLENLRSG